MPAAVVEHAGSPAPDCRARAAGGRPGEVTVDVTAAPIIAARPALRLGHLLLRRPDRRRTCRACRGSGVDADLRRGAVWFATSAGMAAGDGSMRGVAPCPNHDVVALPAGADPVLVAALGLCPRSPPGWRSPGAAAGGGGAGARSGAGGVVGQAAVQLARAAGRRADRGRALGGGGPGAGRAPRVPTPRSRSATPTTSPAGRRLRRRRRPGRPRRRPAVRRRRPRRPCGRCARTDGWSTWAAPRGRRRRLDSSTLRSRSLRVLGYTNNALTPAQRREALAHVVAAGARRPAHHRPRGSGARRRRPACGPRGDRIVLSR